MAKVSKWFRVMVAGATIDGRTIDPKMIDEMAVGYNRATYGARINCEHIRGYSPQPPFNAWGDVLALRAQDDEIAIGGKTERRRALYAQIQPNDDMLAWIAKGQKTYTSVEVTPDFAGTGKAGLVGLAVTDNPASIGTEILEFSTKNPAVKLFTKAAPTNILTPTDELVGTVIELEAAPASDDKFTKLLDAMTGFFTGKKPEPAAVVTPPATTSSGAPADFAAQLGQFASTVTDAVKQLRTDLSADITAQATKLTALEARLASTPAPDQFTRAPATGGAGAALTDC